MDFYKRNKKQIDKSPMKVLSVSLSVFLKRVVFIRSKYLKNPIS